MRLDRWVNDNNPDEQLAPRLSSSILKIAPMAATPATSLVPESISTSCCKSARAFGSHVLAPAKTRASARP